MSDTTIFDELEEKIRDLLTLVQGLRLDYAMGNVTNVQRSIKKAKETVNEVLELLNEL